MLMDITKERIEELYFQKKLSQREIGNMFGCSQMQIRRLMQKFDIKARDYTENKMPTQKGSHLSEAHRLAISKASIGKPGMKGEAHPNWKGGITSENHLIRDSVEMKEWRKQVFERDDYTCQMVNCLKRGVELEANHIRSFAHHPHLRTDINNGITLCKKCHKAITGKPESYLQVYFEYRVKEMTKIYTS